MRYHLLVICVCVAGWMLAAPASIKAFSHDVFPYHPGMKFQTVSEYTYQEPNQRILEDHKTEDVGSIMMIQPNQLFPDTSSTDYLLMSPEARDLFYDITRPLAVTWVVHHIRSFGVSLWNEILDAGETLSYSAYPEAAITLAIHFVGLFGVLQPTTARKKQEEYRSLTESIITDHHNSDRASDPVLLPPFDPVNPGQIDPMSDALPPEIPKVLLHSPDWNPLLTDTWLQCTTYVTMIYELNGFALTGKLVGDAADWILLTDQFHVFQEGHTPVLPQVFDSVVWTDSVDGHVGIVTEVANGVITVANANAPQATYSFRVVISNTGMVSLVPVPGQGIQPDWIPQYWLRPRTKSEESLYSESSDHDVDETGVRATD